MKEESEPRDDLKFSRNHKNKEEVQRLWYRTKFALFE